MNPGLQVKASVDDWLNKKKGRKKKKNFSLAEYKTRLQTSEDILL